MKLLLILIIIIIICIDGARWDANIIIPYRRHYRKSLLLPGSRSEPPNLSMNPYTPSRVVGRTPTRFWSLRDINAPPPAGITPLDIIAMQRNYLLSHPIHNMVYHGVYGYGGTGFNHFRKTQMSYGTAPFMTDGVSHEPVREPFPTKPNTFIPNIGAASMQAEAYLKKIGEAIEPGGGEGGPTVQRMGAGIATITPQQAKGKPAASKPKASAAKPPPSAKGKGKGKF